MSSALNGGMGNSNNDMMSLFAGLNNINNQARFMNILSKLADSYNESNTQTAGVSKINNTAIPQNGYFGMENINPNAEIAKRTDYEYLIGKAADRFDVDSTLIKAIIQAESDFDPECVSGAGAVGLMQLMPATAELMNVSDRNDPEQNINGGVGYFKQQLDSFGGNIKMALAAYNCGPSKLKSLNVSNIDDPDQFARLPKETQNYVTKIINNIK